MRPRWRRWRARMPSDLERKGALRAHGDDQGPLRRLHDDHAQRHARAGEPRRRRAGRARRRAAGPHRGGVAAGPPARRQPARPGRPSDRGASPRGPARRRPCPSRTESAPQAEQSSPGPRMRSGRGREPANVESRCAEPKSFADRRAPGRPAWRESWHATAPGGARTPRTSEMSPQNEPPEVGGDHDRIGAPARRRGRADSSSIRACGAMRAPIPPLARIRHRDEQRRVIGPSRRHRRSPGIGMTGVADQFREESSTAYEMSPRTAPATRRTAAATCASKPTPATLKKQPAVHLAHVNRRVRRPCTRHRASAVVRIGGNRRVRDASPLPDPTGTMPRTARP